MKGKVSIESKKKKYYSSIVQLMHMGKTQYAKRELENFLQIYPDDKIALGSYIKLLFKTGELDLVKEICEENIEYDRDASYYYALVQKYNNDLETSKRLFLKSYNMGKERALIQYIIILIKEEEYEKAYEYFRKISIEYMEKNKKEINLIRRYIYKNIFPELNEIIKDDSSNYFINQIISYDSNILEDKINENTKSKFESEISIQSIIDYSKDKIENEEPSYSDLFDRYIVKYPKVGLCDGKKTDYIMVITCLNTKDIVNIYPCSKMQIQNIKNSDVVEKKYTIE